MSAEVWKFGLKHGSNEIQMPYGAEILTAQVQAERLMLWADVNTTAPKVTRRFFVAMTGEQLPIGRKYIATVQEDWFVVHVFKDCL